MHGALREVVVRDPAVVVEEFKIIVCTRDPIVISQRRIEAPRGRTAAIFAAVVNEIIVKILPNVFVNCACRAIRVVVVACGDDEIRVPTFDEIGDIQQRLPRQPVIANDSESDPLSLGMGGLLCFECD